MSICTRVLTFQHPATGETVTFTRPIGLLRRRPTQACATPIIEPEQTNTCRLIHGASDGWPGWYVERLGDFLLSQSERELTDPQRRAAGRIDGRAAGTYHKRLERRIQRVASVQASPRLVLGASRAGTIRDPRERRSVRIEFRGRLFRRSLSRSTRQPAPPPDRAHCRRILIADCRCRCRLTGQRSSATAARFRHNRQILNVFAYTCGFSVCAALAGARTTSLDLSKKYLEWGRRNFALNGLDPGGHDFIFGDAFDWLRRLAKQGRIFDVVLLDPPTFSQSKSHGVFRAEKDYGALVSAALPLLKPGGVLFASTNAAGLGAGRISRAGGDRGPFRAAKNSPATLRSAAAGLSHLTSGTGLSENRLAAVDVGQASRLSPPAPLAPRLSIRLARAEARAGQARRPSYFFSRSNDRVIRLTGAVERDRRSIIQISTDTIPARTSAPIQIKLRRRNDPDGAGVVASSAPVDC